MSKRSKTPERKKKNKSKNICYINNYLHIAYSLVMLYIFFIYIYLYFI